MGYFVRICYHFVGVLVFVMPAAALANLLFRMVSCLLGIPCCIIFSLHLFYWIYFFFSLFLSVSLFYLLYTWFEFDLIGIAFESYVLLLILGGSSLRWVAANLKSHSSFSCKTWFVAISQWQCRSYVKLNSSVDAHPTLIHYLDDIWYTNACTCYMIGSLAVNHGQHTGIMR